MFISSLLQQGEGAPDQRKGMCANHVRDVTNLLKVSSADSYIL